MQSDIDDSIFMLHHSYCDLFTLNDLLNATKMLSPNKSVSPDGLQAENFLYAPTVFFLKHFCKS